MGIRFLCPNGHRLNVKEFLAGKRGICPNCDVRFLVPMQSGGRVEAIQEPADALASAEAEPDRQGELPQETAAQLTGNDWHIRSAAGTEQGPISLTQIKAWIQQGHIDVDSWLWRTGWLDWQRASDVFPEIAATTDPQDVSGAIQVEPIAVVADEKSFVPQESEVVATHRRLQRERRQRARLITLALIGLICLLAIVLVIVLKE